MSTFNDLINLNELDQKILCKEAIENLTPRLQLIAVRRFYQNQSLNSIAEELGVTYARAYQLERKLLYTIKRYLKSQWL